MARKDPRIDAYIKNAAPFARPILVHIRSVVHAACPDVEETIKWGMPTFDYHGILCGMGAFQSHAVFGFWKGKLILDGKGRDLDDAMGQFGRLTTVADLPSKRVITGYVKKAMALNEAGIKVERKPKPKQPIPMPPSFKAALAKSPKAASVFDGFSPSAQRDYLEWITEAKTDATRDKRIATTIEWLKEGKRRNWKYERA